MTQIKKTDELNSMARRMRLQALDMGLAAGASGAHFGAGFSSMEIMAVLYGSIMKLNPNDPTDRDRDRLFISKAHCVLSYYTALHEAGFLSNEDLATFEQPGTHLAGHPSTDSAHGIDYSWGSLGMALSFGVGTAIGLRDCGLSNRRVFVLLGDGELDEGSNWEAFMSGSHFALDHLTAIIDRNVLQYDGPTEEVMALGDLHAKLDSFGWDTVDVDGHDVDALQQALSSITPGKPRAVIAHTIKGKGVSFMEGKREWHHSSLSREQYDLAVAELKGE